MSADRAGDRSDGRDGSTALSAEERSWNTTGVVGPHVIDPPPESRFEREALADVERLVEATAVHASAFFDAEAQLLIRRSVGTVARRAPCPRGAGRERIEASASQGDSDVRLVLLRDEPFEPVDAALAQQVAGQLAAALARAPSIAALTAGDLGRALLGVAAEVAAVESALVDAAPELLLSLSRARCALTAAASLHAGDRGGDRFAATVLAQAVEALAPLAHVGEQRIVFGRMDAALLRGDASVLAAAVLHLVRAALTAGPPTLSVAVERRDHVARFVVRRVRGEPLPWSSTWRAALAEHQLGVGCDVDGDVSADWLCAVCE